MKNGKTGRVLLVAVIGAVAVALLWPKRAPVAPEAKALTVALANREAVVCGFPQGTSTNQSPTARGTLPYVVACAVPADKPIRLAAEATGARVVGNLDEWRKTNVY